MGWKEKFTSSPYWDGTASTPGQRRRARIILAGILAVVLLAAGLLWWEPWRAGDGKPDSAAPAPAASASAPQGAPSQTASTPSAGGSTQCAAPGAGGAIRTAAPQVARWELKTTAYVPVNEAVGPCSITAAGAPEKFARSEAGALFAAQWYAGALDVSGVLPGWKDRIGTAVKAGPGRDIMAATAQAVADRTVAAPKGRDTRVQTCGYRIASYSDAAARVELAVGPTEAWLSPVMVFGLELAWEGGDWKAVATLDGKLFTTADASAAGGLAGFVPWGPPGFAGAYR